MAKKKDLLKLLDKLLSKDELVMLIEELSEKKRQEKEKEKAKKKAKAEKKKKDKKEKKESKAEKQSKKETPKSASKDKKKEKKSESAKKAKGQSIKPKERKKGKPEKTIEKKEPKDKKEDKTSEPHKKTEKPKETKKAIPKARDLEAQLQTADTGVGVTASVQTRGMGQISEEENMDAGTLVPPAASTPIHLPKGIKRDDLKIVVGIGPKIDSLLLAEDILTWDQLSKTDPARIKDILLAAGPRYRSHDPSTWPQQAALAAEGKWEELNGLQDRLKGRRQA
jgi:predicted flap endonuclease-1-like 5' DNA nuclease